MTSWNRIVELLVAHPPELSPSGPSAPSTMASDSAYREVVIRSPKSVVHLEYKPSSLPTKPADGNWTRFVCISDTHTRNSFSVPDGDVLLHSGDLTTTGTVADFEKTMEWLYSMPHKIKIIIAGNHDLTLHTEWYETNFMRWHRGKQNVKVIHQMLKGPKAVKAGIVYLQDEEYKFRVTKHGKEWSVYGSPWSPEFGNWAFNYEREDAEALIAKFPKTDILLTHGPPHQILDRTIVSDEAGCEALRTRLPELRPRLHVFGHIHEAHGAYLHTWDSDDLPTVQNSDPVQASSDTETVEDDDKERTVFANAANWPMGELSRRDGVRSPFGGPGFQPIVVDLKEC